MTTTSLHRSNVRTPEAVTIALMKDADDAKAFHDLNAEWIKAHFEMEEGDLEILNHPHRQVIEPGGQIYLAFSDGRAVGCVALMAYGPDVYKVVKMAVTAEYRGRGIGRQLLVHAIEQARLLAARTLFLTSSSTLLPAISLYESIGFQHLSADEWPFMRFARANVFMRMDL